MLGYAEPAGGMQLVPPSPRVELRYQHTPRPMLEFTAPVVPMPASQLSPRPMVGGGARHAGGHTGASQILLERFQSRLAAHPDLWMVQDKKEAGVPQDEIKAFMATAPTACKFLLTKVKDCEVFINEDFDDKGAICLREWAEQGNVYYYIEPGLERVRC